MEGANDDPQGKGSILPGAGGPRGFRPPFVPSHSIQFDVTVEERVEYRPDLATVSKALAEQAARSAPSSAHRPSSQRSHPDGRRASRAHDEDGSITTEQTLARFSSLQVNTPGPTSSSPGPLTPAAPTPRSTTAEMHRDQSTASLAIKRPDPSFHSGMSNNNSLVESCGEEVKQSPASIKKGLRSSNTRPRSEPRHGGAEEDFVGTAQRPYSASTPRRTR